METFSRETLDPWFVTGFADGQASFTFSRSGKQLALYFSIKADSQLLEEIQRYFGGIGTIYPLAGKASALFRVTRSSDLTRVVDHFDAYPLQTQKRAAFRIWRNMVELKRDFRNADRETLETLARELSKHRARRGETR